MRTIVFYLSWLWLFLLPMALPAQSTVYESPVQYMSDISLILDKVQADTWSYTNAVSHSRNARKIEKKRLEIIETIKTAKNTVFKMPGFKGDKSLRDSAYAYLKVTFAVMTEDYSKLVNMEEVAEQSFDAMEAYLLAQEIASAKQDTAILMLNSQFRAFAAKYNITINEMRDKTAEKLIESEKVYKFHNQVYLIFFKSLKQEIYVMDALNRSDMSALKQNIDALQKFSDEGLQKLQSIPAYKGDASLVSACRDALQFYRQEANEKLKPVVDFLATQEKFEKIKKSMNSKPAGNRTQADIDEYNKAVNDVNTASNKVNTILASINADRAKWLNNWNNAANTFIDKHVPKNN